MSAEAFRINPYLAETLYITRWRNEGTLFWGQRLHVFLRKAQCSLSCRLWQRLGSTSMLSRKWVAPS